MTINFKDKKIDVISFLKGFSILTIILMHLIQYYIKCIPSFIKTAVSVGGTGVHVFFLCSGFGLFLSYLNKKPSFLNFIEKRLKKIYIPYILVVLISFLLPWIYVAGDRILALLSHIFLYKMFIPEYVQSFGVHFWFISTIIQLYLLFIPLCWLKDKLNNNKLFLLSMLFVSILWWILVYVNELSGIRVWNSFCLQYLWEFAFGMCLAEYIKINKKVVLNKLFLFVFAILGISIQAILTLASPSLAVFNDIPALFGYISFALLLYNIPLIRKIGNITAIFSYELYLIHILVIATFFHFFNFSTLGLQILVGCVSIIFCFVLAFLYFKVMKKIVYKD